MGCNSPDLYKYSHWGQGLRCNALVLVSRTIATSTNYQGLYGEARSQGYRVPEACYAGINI